MDYYPSYISSDIYPPSREDILEKYDFFFANFPDSYFSYNQILVDSFLEKLMFKGGVMSDDISFLKNKYKDSNLYKFLSNKAVEDSFIRGYNMWIKDTGK